MPHNKIKIRDDLDYWGKKICICIKVQQSEVQRKHFGTVTNKCRDTRFKCRCRRHRHLFILLHLFIFPQRDFAAVYFVVCITQFIINLFN